MSRALIYLCLNKHWGAIYCINEVIFGMPYCSYLSDLLYICDHDTHTQKMHTLQYNCLWCNTVSSEVRVYVLYILILYS